MTILLKSVKKKYKADSHQSVEPTHTVKKAKLKLDSLKKYGYTNLQEIGKLDSMGLPVYKVSSLERANEWGKGATLMQSKASALMERVERYSSMAKFQDFKKITSKFKDICDNALSREKFGLLNLHRVLYGDKIDEMEMDWVKAYSLISKDEIYVPAQSVFFRYPRNFPFFLSQA